LKRTMKGLQLCLCFLSLASLALSKSAPTWPNQYYVSGTFDIPYFNIVENLELYYDGANNRQLFSYYNGTDNYLWRFDIQTLFQVVPRIDQLVCFVSTGIGSGPLVTLLPDLSTWTYQGQSLINGKHCDNWQQTVTDLNVTAVYNMYVNPSNNYPVQLVLNGYDFVFGSHPDIYIMNYDVYRPNWVNASVFTEPELCQNTSTSFHSVSAGIRAKALLGKLSIVSPPKDLHDPFRKFMFKHKKVYTDIDEYYMRREIYKKNLKRIEAHNSRTDVTFQMGENQFSDMTAEEISALIMPKRPSSLRAKSRASATSYHTLSGQQIPPSINWVDKGAVNPPKDQGVCGSCWTFGTAGSLEGAWFVKTGTLVSLAEQQLVDCAWGQWQNGNNGCDGGFAGPALQWIINNGGMALESDYPYMMQDQFCNADIRTSGVTVQSYVNVTEFSEEALQDAVATIGPVAVAIDAAHEEFEYYKSGVYYNPNCKNDIDSLDHEVLVVGYGTEDGQDYWLVKNSWSTHWGDNGYVKMSRNRNNNCGIATQATYPLV